MDLQSAVYFAFLGLIAVLHRPLGARGRVLLLLAASMVFYAFSSPGFLVMLLLLSALNYGAVLRLARSDDGRARTALFAGIVGLDVMTLVFFKYLVRPLNAWLALAPAGPQELLRLGIPLGISYFTFQMVSATTDAYRREWQPAGRDLPTFILFGLFFPQITSGPIPRAPRLIPQLALETTPALEDRLDGLRLIAYGLVKKFVVANRLADYVNQVFASPTGATSAHFSTLPAMIGCLFNVLDLYADFSSYVDIALGSARILGIRLDPNFDRPFVSTSVTEFWRRWHMTLSFWLRDYVYMPLLIRIRSLGAWSVSGALILTFAICGVWHDATWPYVSFGVAQGCAMSTELVTKRWRGRHLRSLPAPAMLAAGWLYTMVFFALSEVLFRAPSLEVAGRVFFELMRPEPLHSMAELFAYKGPFDFAMDFVALAVWATLASVVRRDSRLSTPWFVFACALLVLFLGRLSSGQFIYAGF